MENFVRNLPVLAASLVSSLCEVPACDEVVRKWFQCLKMTISPEKQINTHEILPQLALQNCPVLASPDDFQLKRYWLQAEGNKTPTL
jgi:hypothetical protein